MLRRRRGRRSGSASPKYSVITPERDTSLELATFGLGSVGYTVHQSAPECTKPDFAADGAIQGAQECTFGADSGGRSKDGGVPAVRIEEAIRALLAGDVETARRLLR
ncbi:MAG TPA: hypothetical protein VN894_08030 [Polyangiaceae bacterium]|nr:hypothetical protein [Polyangiaceae bacterium]